MIDDDDSVGDSVGDIVVYIIASANHFACMNAHSLPLSAIALGSSDKHCYQLQGHDNRVSCLGMAPSGEALCTGTLTVRTAAS